MPRILQFSRTGGPDCLEFREVDLPDPGPNEVRYRVSAFALNRGDLFWLSGTYYNHPTFPARIGQEACGIVDAVGADVREFGIGDRVCSLVQEDGRYCVNGEFAVTPARYLVKSPNHLSDVEACAVWSQALTAYYPFAETRRLTPQHTVLVTAGSSTSGNGAIQMAKLLGARVVATSRSLEKEQFLRTLGADAVIPTAGNDELADRILAATQRRGVDVVFDTVAGAMMSRYFGALAAGAVVYIVGALGGDLDLSGSILPLVRSGASITGYSVFNHNRINAHLDRAKAFITDALVNRLIWPVVDRVFEFRETISAYHYLASGAQRGKVVVKV